MIFPFLQYILILFQPRGKNGGLGAQANGGGGHAVLAVGKVFHLSFREAVKNLADFFR